MRVFSRPCAGGLPPLPSGGAARARRFELPATTLQCTPVEGGWRLAYGDGACYEIRQEGGGVEVAIGPGHQAHSAEHQARLRGAVTAFVAALTGHFPLHAAGLVAPGGVVGISGAPGAGKSTLTALALRQGYEATGDDLTIVDPAGRVVWANPVLRVEPGAAPPGIREGGESADGRRAYRLERPRATTLAFRAVARLERGSAVRLTPLRGSARLLELARSGYLTLLDLGPGSAAPEVLDTLLARCGVYRLEVPTGLAGLEGAWPEIAAALSVLATAPASATCC